ncbi:MAG: Thiol-disulfide oxidoreductase resA [Bacteroidetes bacterium]|jgi:peroxiredoxin|nr:Thiol-disulfide oxidoreductase resA [Bacteroidota bacterium]
MKKIITPLCLLLSFFAVAQQAYQVKGKLTKADQIEKAFLAYMVEGKQKIDTAVVVNGAFQFSGTVTSPKQARLAFGRKEKAARNNDVAMFYIEKGVVTINGVDSAKTAVISSPLNDDYTKLKNLLKPVSVQQEALMKEYQAATPEQKKDEVFMAKIEARDEELSKQEKMILKSFLQQNKSSFVNFFVLSQIGGYAPDVAEIEPLFQSLSSSLKSTTEGKEFAEKIASLKAVGVGAIAPDFTQNDTKGNPVKLSSFRGKYILVDFWASWCGPCRRENPAVLEAYNQFKDKNFTILGVSLDNAQANWEKAIEADKLAWTQVSDLRGWQNEVAVLYGVQSIPQNFLLDPNGKILAKNLRGEELKSKLNELIK